MNTDNPSVFYWCSSVANSRYGQRQTKSIGQAGELGGRGMLPGHAVWVNQYFELVEAPPVHLQILFHFLERPRWLLGLDQVVMPASFVTISPEHLNAQRVGRGRRGGGRRGALLFR